jgi:hypothetical protein
MMKSWQRRTSNPMSLVLKDLKKVLSFLVSVIARLDRSPHSPQRTRPSAGTARRGEAIRKKELDYPVKLDNDNYCNRVHHV